MKSREAAARASELLTSAGIEDAAFEAEYLVRAAGGLTRAGFLLDPELSERQAAELQESIERRVLREPATYITGVREFWGLEIGVGPGVLVPRPETEMLVEVAVSEAASCSGRPTIVDTGTGSGCVAIAVALELNGRAHVAGSDVSADALAIAARNAARHCAPVSFVRGDLLTWASRAGIVLANLPYIPSFEIDLLEPEVSEWEPRVALDGGPDGFALIRRLLDDCATRLRPRLLALEVGFGMAAETRDLALAAGADVDILPDLAGIDRVVCCRWH